MLEMSSSMSKPSTESAMSYFLELYGETSPEVDLEYADVLATRGKSNAGPIYEYFWTLGRVEHISASSRFSPRKVPFFPRKGSAGTDWGKLSRDSFTQVYVLFPRNSDWRVHELAVSVKYLAPVDQQKTVMQEMGKDLAALQPLLGVAGTAVGAVGAAAGAGPAASATGHVLDAMAKMKIGNVPQTKDFDWSVRKVTIKLEEDAMEPSDGVVWYLPPLMLESLGSRINGSIAVSLVPLSGRDMKNGLNSTLQSGNVRAWATLPLRSAPSLPGVSLQLTPRAPADEVMPGHEMAPESPAEQGN
jgi:hypothetical protein